MNIFEPIRLEEPIKMEGKCPGDGEGNLSSFRTDRVEMHEMEEDDRMVRTPALTEAERVTVQVRGLSLMVPHKKSLMEKVKGREGKEKRILWNVSCDFKPGRLTAVMGSSGAGKTSLLKLVAGDKPKRSSHTGHVLVNGQSTSAQEIKKLSGFVFQDDVLLPTMTAKEAIVMAARLKGQDTSVDEIIRVLGLGKVENNLIGEPSKRGLSGGERKRVSIGMELVTDPTVIFLDEPTSGLDAYTACNVIDYLRRLTRQGRTIIATIHQPSSKLYHMFDDIVLLAEGEIVYYGPCEEAIEYFGQQGFPCPQFVNPADHFFMEVLQEKNLPALKEAWRNRPNPDVQYTPFASSKPMRNVAVSFWTQFGFLLKRSSRNLIRNRMILPLKLSKTLFFGSLIAAIYGGSGTESMDANIQNRVSCLYFLLTNEFFGNIGTAISIFTVERPVFIREYRNGYYPVIAYFLSKFIVELPAQIIFPIATMSIPYWIVGYQSNLKCYSLAALSFVLVANASAALGMLLGGVFTRIETALAVMPMIMMPLMIFGGFLVNLGAIPWYFRWLKYISPIKRAFVALAKNEFTGDKMGEEAMRRYSIDQEPSIWSELTVLACMYVILLSIAFAGLLRIARMRK